MGRPNNGHSCICPDGMHVELQSSGSEKCLCPNGQVPQANGSCPLGTFCLFIPNYLLVRSIQILFVCWFQLTKLARKIISNVKPRKRAFQFYGGATEITTVTTNRTR